MRNDFLTLGMKSFLTLWNVKQIHANIEEIILHVETFHIKNIALQMSMRHRQFHKKNAKFECWHAKESAMDGLK